MEIRNGTVRQQEAWLAYHKSTAIHPVSLSLPTFLRQNSRTGLERRAATGACSLLAPHTSDTETLLGYPFHPSSSSRPYTVHEEYEGKWQLFYVYASRPISYWPPYASQAHTLRTSVNTMVASGPTCSGFLSPSQPLLHAHLWVRAPVPCPPVGPTRKQRHRHQARLSAS